MTEEALIDKVAAFLYAPNQQEREWILQKTATVFQAEISTTRLTGEEEEHLTAWFQGFQTMSWKRGEHICVNTIEFPEGNERVYGIKLDTCAEYISELYDVIVSKAFSAPVQPGETKAQRRTLLAAHDKLRVTIEQEAAKYRELNKRIEQKCRERVGGY